MQGQNSSVVASAGETNQQDNIVISWTLGETVITTENGESMLISQGFHQPFTIDSAIHVPNVPIYIVYPNPTRSFIQLKAQDSDHLPIHLQLTDLNGKLIFREDMLSTDYKKNLQDLDSGLYILTLINNKNETIKSYKIIKH